MSQEYNYSHNHQTEEGLTSNVPAFLSVPREQLEGWLQADNLQGKQNHEFEGFSITESIDGRAIEEREVSLVTISGKDQYPQHVHKNSDAKFYIVSGTGAFLSGDDRKVVQEGDEVDIPRGMPHGFVLKKGESLTFVSIQSPPIKDEHTGEEDFHLVDRV